jgi:hypothetical protein
MWEQGTRIREGNTQYLVQLLGPGTARVDGETPNHWPIIYRLSRNIYLN